MTHDDVIGTLRRLLVRRRKTPYKVYTTTRENVTERKVQDSIRGSEFCVFLFCRTSSAREERDCDSAIDCLEPESHTEQSRSSKAKERD